MRYVKLHEVCVGLEIEDDLLQALLDEGLIHVKQTLDEETVISAEDAERLRVAVLLIRDLDVNLPGAEVILHMREDLLSMQRQFQEILHELVDELRKRIG